MAHEGYHEAEDKLKPSTKDFHRALVSLEEELEAVDWYQQRADVCDDDALREILLHNRREEIEHAMMVLEWIRRNDPTFDANVGTYLNSNGPITSVEETATDIRKEAPNERGAAAPPVGESMTRGDGSLGIGSLRAPPLTPSEGKE